MSDMSRFDMAKVLDKINKRLDKVEGWGQKTSNILVRLIAVEDEVAKLRKPKRRTKKAQS